MKILVALIVSLIISGCVSQPSRIISSFDGSEKSEEQKSREDEECKLEANWAHCMHLKEYRIRGGQHIPGSHSGQLWRADGKSDLTEAVLREKLKISSVYFLPIEHIYYRYEVAVENPMLNISPLVGIFSRMSGCKVNAHSEVRYIRDSLPRLKLSEIVSDELSSNFELEGENTLLLKPNIKKLIDSENPAPVPMLSNAIATKLDFGQIDFEFPQDSFVFLFATEVMFGGSMIESKLISILSWYLFDVSSNQLVALGRNPLSWKPSALKPTGTIYFDELPSALALQKDESLSSAVAESMRSAARASVQKVWLKGGMPWQLYLPSGVTDAAHPDFADSEYNPCRQLKIDGNESTNAAKPSL